MTLNGLALGPDPWSTSCHGATDVAREGLSTHLPSRDSGVVASLESAGILKLPSATAKSPCLCAGLASQKENKDFCLFEHVMVRTAGAGAGAGTLESRREAEEKNSSQRHKRELFMLVNTKEVPHGRSCLPDADIPVRQSGGGIYSTVSRGHHRSHSGSPACSPQVLTPASCRSPRTKQSSKQSACSSRFCLQVARAMPLAFY